MNYVFKERLKTSLFNLVWFAVIILVIDAIVACSLAPSIPAVFAVIAWICIFTLGLYALGAVIFLFCIWVNWLFIDPFKKKGLPR